MPNKDDLSFLDDDENSAEEKEITEKENEVEAYKEKLKEMEKIIAEQGRLLDEYKTQKQPAPQTNTAVSDWERIKEEQTKRFWEDPLAVVNEITNFQINNLVQTLQDRFFAPMQNQQMLLQREQAKRVVRGAKKDFGEYEADIDTILQYTPPEAMSPQTVLSAYFIAKGMRNEGGLEPFVESSSGGEREAIEEEEPLTPDELKTIKGSGMSTEDYKKAKKILSVKTERRGY